MRHTGFSVVASDCSTLSCRLSTVIPVTCSRHALYTPSTKSEVGLETCSGLMEYPHPLNASTISAGDIDGNQNLLDIVGNTEQGEREWNNRHGRDPLSATVFCLFGTRRSGDPSRRVATRGCEPGASSPSPIILWPPNTAYRSLPLFPPTSTPLGRLAVRHVASAE